ncbi:chemotaxis protein CheX [Fundidesulfovibrio butyratiphilus]
MIDVATAKPFVDATVSVLSTMARITPRPKTPFIKEDRAATGDVSGIIGVTGDKTGSISITFDKACAIAVVKAMLGDDIQDILADVKDAVGEITNMISGQARGHLAKAGVSLSAGTPMVIFGDNHEISHTGSGPVVAIPFVTDHGKFSVEFCFS